MQTLPMLLVQGETFQAVIPCSKPVTAVLWGASQFFARNAVAVAFPANGIFYLCTTPGYSGSTQPTWPTTPGVTVLDGACVWTCQTTNVAPMQLAGATATASIRATPDASDPALLDLTVGAGIAINAFACPPNITITVTPLQVASLLPVASYGCWDLLVTLIGGTPFHLVGGNVEFAYCATRS